MKRTPHDFEALMTAYAEAVLAKEPSRLAALYDAEVRVFDAWGRWSYDDLAAWRSNVDDWLGSLGEARVQVRFEDVRAVTRGDMCALNAIVTYAAIDRAGQTLHAMHNRLSWVLVRRGDSDDWAIAHEHTSAPIGFDDMKAILQRS